MYKKAWLIFLVQLLLKIFLSLLRYRLLTALCIGYKNVLTIVAHGKRLLFAAVVSCPWYESTQSEYCLKAKHNQLVVVYLCKDNQFFAPVNRHVKEKDCDVFEHEVCCRVTSYSKR